MWYEHARTVWDRKGLMLPEYSLEGLTGFRSVYGFCERDAMSIRHKKSSCGFAQFPVYSNKLLMDFDHNETGMLEAVNWANKKELSWELYESGGKGFHLEIKTIELFDINLPYTHKKLCEKLGFGNDPSLYRHGSLFRLPGTIHDKTHKPKKKIDGFSTDNLLEITIEAPEECIHFDEFSDQDSLNFALGSIKYYLGESPGAGNRYTLIFGLGADLCRSGVSFSAALELALLLDGSWGEDAKGEEETARAIENGFRYAGNDLTR